MGNSERKPGDKVFLLTGKPRMGKTTHIKKIISKIGPDLCGGFYTEEIRDANDRIGFTCVTLAGESQEFANVSSNSSLRVGRYGIEIGIFEHVALTALQDAMKSKKVLVIDEIGFMQLLSGPFQQLIDRIMSEKKQVVLGTIALQSHPEIDRIKELPGVTIIMLDEDNRDSLTDVVVKELLHALNS